MARTKLSELARLSGGLRTGGLGDGRLGDCLDAADRQGEGVFASTTGLDEEDYGEDPEDDQDSPPPSVGRKRFRTQKALEALETELVLTSWVDGTKLDLSRAFRRSDFPPDMFCIPSRYLKKAKKEYGDGSSPARRGAKRGLKRPNKAVQQAIKEIPQAMALALADLLSTACFPDF